MQQRNFTQGLRLVEKRDIEMNAPVQAIRVQETPEKEDIGFYARVPRIVRTGYQELSHAEKWLYTCLRDLCGEAGECWRSLRALAKETGISIASLSSMIPHLEKVGLIDAVKKSTWFIKIKNIWQANKEYCSKIEHSTAKCSENEQGVQKMNTDCSENEQGCSNFVTKEDRTKKIESEEDNTKKDITSPSGDDAYPPYKDGLKPRNSILSGWLADMSLLDDAFLAEMEKLLPPADLSTPLPYNVDNDTMSHSHVVQATRNEGEDDGTDTQHSRDNSAGRLRTGTLLPISGGSGLHHDSHPEGYQESAQRRGRLEAAPPQEQPHALQVGATSPPARETRKRGVGKKAPDAIDITVEGMEVYRDWCSLFKVTVPLNKAIAKAANELVEPLAVWAVVKGCSHKEVLKLIKNWLYENDKNGYYSRGVKLYDIAREFEGWQSKQEQPQSMNGTGKKYKPSPDEELVEWQGQMMTVAEADKRGFNGGFGEYVSQQQW